MFPLCKLLVKFIQLLVLINLLYEFQTRTIGTVKEVCRLGLFLDDCRKYVDWYHSLASLLSVLDNAMSTHFVSHRK